MSEALKSGQLNRVGVPDRLRVTIKPDEAVLLKAPHPHAGKVGRYRGVEYLSVPDKWACKVDLQQGGGCYVFNAGEWEKVR